MEKPYRVYALLFGHDESKFPGMKSILTYGVVTLDMSLVGKAPSCDFGKFVVLGFEKTPDELKDNLDDTLMIAHKSLVTELGDMDIDLERVVVMPMPLGSQAQHAYENLVEKFYAGMLEELKK